MRRTVSGWLERRISIPRTPIEFVRKCPDDLCRDAKPAASIRLGVWRADVNEARRRPCLKPRNMQENHNDKEFLNELPTTGGAIFARRLSTEEGMRRLSRYLATVRRAITMSATLRRATITSSESTSCGSSASIICLILKRTDSAECASPTPFEAIDVEKKYFISNRPRGVWIYLFEVTRETVDSCMPIASATVFRLSGRKPTTPSMKNPSCRRTISVATFKIVRARCSRLLVSQLAFCRLAVRKRRSASLVRPRL